MIILWQNILNQQYVALSFLLTTLPNRNFYRGPILLVSRHHCQRINNLVNYIKQIFSILLLPGLFCLSLITLYFFILFSFPDFLSYSLYTDISIYLLIHFSISLYHSISVSWLFQLNFYLSIYPFSLYTYLHIFLSFNICISISIHISTSPCLSISISQHLSISPYNSIYFLWFFSLKKLFYDRNKSLVKLIRSFPLTVWFSIKKLILIRKILTILLLKYSYSPIFKLYPV